MLPQALLRCFAVAVSLLCAAAGADAAAPRADTPCPVVNGEALSRCGTSCYSRYRYTCRDGHGLSPRAAPTGAFRLYAEGGSTLRSQPMTACHLRWGVGGRTCSRCPNGSNGGGHVPLPCPAGDVAVVALSTAGEASMAAEVAGGQAVYLTRNFTVEYQPAHTSTLPDGARRDGFEAFAGGGFFFNAPGEGGGSYGWAVCGGGAGGTKRLHAKNSTNADELKSCVGVNLRVEDYDGSGAFQYI